MLCFSEFPKTSLHHYDDDANGSTSQNIVRSRLQNVRTTAGKS